jgi:hypothetical protein
LEYAVDERLDALMESAPVKGALTDDSGSPR